MKHFLIMAAFCVGACSYPVTSVHTVEAHPALQIIGAPPSAVLFVDQQQAGWARNFGEGGQRLVLAHGTHRVDVRNGAAVLYSSDVYFGDDTTKTITLLPEVR